MKKKIDRCLGRVVPTATAFFILFLTFFNNILNLTWLEFYFCIIARLVAPSELARQLAFVVPVRVARQSRHASSGPLRAPRRQQANDVDTPVAPPPLARQVRSAALLSRSAQNGLHLCRGGVSAQLCRATMAGATNAFQKRHKVLLLLCKSLFSFHFHFPFLFHHLLLLLCCF